MNSRFKKRRNNELNQGSPITRDESEKGGNPVIEPKRQMRPCTSFAETRGIKGHITQKLYSGPDNRNLEFSEHLTCNTLM